MGTLFRVMATGALTPVHAGMWLWEDLSRDYCVRCRRWLSFLSVVMAAITLSLAYAGFRWARKQGLFAFKWK